MLLISSRCEQGGCADSGRRCQARGRQAVGWLAPTPPGRHFPYDKLRVSSSPARPGKDSCSHSFCGLSPSTPLDVLATFGSNSRAKPSASVRTLATADLDPSPSLEIGNCSSLESDPLSRTCLASTPTPPTPTPTQTTMVLSKPVSRPLRTLLPKAAASCSAAVSLRPCPSSPPSQRRQQADLHPCPAWLPMTGRCIRQVHRSAVHGG